MNTTNQTLLHNLEKDIVNLLLDKLEFSDMSFERASLIAKFILTHLPENLTDKQVNQILPSLDDKFIELAEIVHKYTSEYKEKEEAKLSDTIQQLIRSGKLDEASAMMKTYFNKKLQS